MDAAPQHEPPNHPAPYRRRFWIGVALIFGSPCLVFLVCGGLALTSLRIDQPMLFAEDAVRRALDCSIAAAGITFVFVALGSSYDLAQPRTRWITCTLCTVAVSLWVPWSVARSLFQEEGLSGLLRSLYGTEEDRKLMLFLASIASGAAAGFATASAILIYANAKPNAAKSTSTGISKNLDNPD